MEIVLVRPTSSTAERLCLLAQTTEIHQTEDIMPAQVLHIHTLTDFCRLLSDLHQCKLDQRTISGALEVESKHA